MNHGTRFLQFCRRQFLAVSQGSTTNSILLAKRMSWQGKLEFLQMIFFAYPKPARGRLVGLG
jgi:hypothetical protein